MARQLPPVSPWPPVRSPMLMSVIATNAPTIEPWLLACAIPPKACARRASPATSATVALAASQRNEEATPWIVRAATMPHVWSMKAKATQVSV